MQTETAVGNLFSLPLTVIKQSEIHLSNTVIYKINTVDLLFDSVVKVWEISQV